MSPLLSKMLILLTLGSSFVFQARAEIAPGDTLDLKLRGVPAQEQEKVNGTYRVSEAGSIRLPFLESRLTVSGLTAEQIAAAAEQAYRKNHIYKSPAIEVEIIKGEGQDAGPAIVTVGGQVHRAGPVPFRKGLTLIQALQLAGDRNPFGGRNITVHRNGKAILLDFRKPEHKNFALQPSDAIVVGQVGVIETDRG